MGFVVRQNKSQAARAVAVFTKWLKKDFQKLMKMRRTELLTWQYLKTHKKATQFGLSVIDGPNSCVFLNVGAGTHTVSS